MTELERRYAPLTMAQATRLAEIRRRYDGAVAGDPYPFADVAWLLQLAEAALLAAPSAPQEPPQEQEAYDYLSRVFLVAAPQCKPLPTLIGLCTQIDNLIAGLVASAPQTISTEGLEQLTQRVEWATGPYLADIAKDIRALAASAPPQGWQPIEREQFLEKQVRSREEHIRQLIAEREDTQQLCVNLQPLASHLEEAAGVLDEPFHRETITTLLLETAKAIRELPLPAPPEAER